MTVRIALAALAAVVLISTGCGGGEKADLILHHGKIVTVDPEFHIVAKNKNPSATLPPGAVRISITPQSLGGVQP